VKGKSCQIYCINWDKRTNQTKVPETVFLYLKIAAIASCIVEYNSVPTSRTVP